MSLFLLHTTMQHKLTSERALSEAPDDASRARLQQQLFELSDTVLDGFRLQLESIKQQQGESQRYCDVSERYAATRRELLQPFSEWMVAVHACAVGCACVGISV